jgi:hypothetical protein
MPAPLRLQLEGHPAARFVFRHLVMTPPPKARTLAPTTGRPPAFTVTKTLRLRFARSRPFMVSRSRGLVPTAVGLFLRLMEWGVRRWRPLGSSTTGP